MKRSFLKATVLLMAATMTITACSTKEGGATASPTGVKADNGFSKGKFDPPITMTTVGAINSTFKFKNGESLENNVHTKWVKDKLGIDIKYNWVTSDDQFATKLRLDMAANNKLPDVTYIDGKNVQLISDLIDSGAMMDIKAAFDKYASPKVKEIYNQDPSNWSQVMKGGKNYGLPMLTRAQQNDPVLWIRTDWLQKINLPEPKNFDELEKVMDAMLKTDFGKGAIGAPLAASIKDPLMPFAQWRGDLSWVFGGYGVMPHFWNKWKGDKLEYGSIQPETKQALARLADWFKKGYIAQDVGMIDVGKSEDPFRNEKAGITAGPVFAGGSIRGNLNKNNPAAVAKPIPIPAGPSGKAGRHGTTATNGAFLINKDFKNVEAFFLYINKMYEIGDPAKGSEFENGGFEGYDYIMKDGKASFVEADFPDKLKASSFKYYIGNQLFQDPYLELKTQLKFYNGEQPTTPYEINTFAGVPEADRKSPKTVYEWNAAKVTLDQKSASIQNLFNGPQTETMKSKWESLVKMESETFLKIVYGKEPIDAFDTFVKNWKSMGGDKITEEVNAWYKASTGK
ncbi:type 2 periplasmic-binding domain-containing protein [Paenibacillus roseipurpureus]|uniref:Extracellular solute-binding protein n=1 Tax=Paenibacillus roseopurpureus TaxID=2918901 RepID=A0AA96LS07_9BACL|nr:extracellular solute-binding protein [Paenibacillus sp. MBLB1832]WNR46152.1 extracellular solute-binding protein [Paenibacillus sp. MBLB1832]